MRNIDELEDYADYVEAGCEVLEGHTRDFWYLGELAENFEAKIGRPSKEDLEEDVPTLRDLARAWDQRVSKVSMWRSNHLFYPQNVRLDELSFSHHDLARRNADGKLENALELLETAKDQNMSKEDFRRWLSGTFFEMPIERHKLPDEVRYLVPAPYKEILLIGRRLKEDG